MYFSEIIKLQFDKKKMPYISLYFITFRNYCFLIISKLKKTWSPPFLGFQWPFLRSAFAATTQKYLSIRHRP